MRLNATIVKIIISENTLKQNSVGQWEDILYQYCLILFWFFQAKWNDMILTV